jgi:phage shock protein C
MKSFSPNKLYKDGKNGKLAGVCAGLGDYFGIQPNLIRAVVILTCLFGFFPPIVVIYVVLAFVLDEKPVHLRENPKEDEFWRDVRIRPDFTAFDLKRRFGDIEKRTRKLEAYITSKRYRLQRELRELEE